MTVRFSILGPLAVRDGAGRPVAVGGTRLRRLLAMLLLAPGRTVGTERLIDGIWGSDAPAGAGNALQALVSRLRKLLGDQAPVVGDASGYRLEVAPEQIDLWRFEDLVRRGRRARARGAAAEASDLLGRALELWRGDPLPEFAEAGGEGEAVRLAEQLRAVQAEHLEARVEAGDHAAALPEIEALAAREPLRERPVELLMRALAASGRTVDALSAYERLRTGLAEELGIDPSERIAELHLRLLRGELEGAAPAEAVPPERAAEDGGRADGGGDGGAHGGAHGAGPGSGAEAGRAPAAEGPPVRLPASLTAFVARDEELGAALGLLSGERLVTLVGPGGSGKTRLAVETGTRLAAERPELVPDGVWFIDLAPLRDGAAVPEALLDALGVRERAVTPLQVGGTADDPLVRAAEVLSGRRLLLVADNCEHLVADVADAMERLLAVCPGVRVLATSREPLGVTGERLQAVPPLALPPEGAGAEEAAGYASVRLFADRVRAWRPSFTVDEDSAGPVVRICRELDGMPLALELAAARVRAMPLPQLAERLTDRFRLLASGPRQVRPRHQTLQAVVDWSWELLDGAEQALLRRLSVFAGGASLDAVEAVCADAALAPAPTGAPEGPGEAGEGDPGAPLPAGGGTVGGRDVWSVLFALVDKSLVEADGADEVGHGQPRYRMLETVRAYGAQRLAESGERDRVRAAHARHMRWLWRAAEEPLRGPGQLEWLARLREEHENYAAAVRRTVASGDAGAALDMVHIAFLYGMRVDAWSDLSRWAEEALALAGDTPPPGHELAYAECRFAHAIEKDMGRRASGPEEAGEIVEAIRAELEEIERIVEAVGERCEDHLSLVFVPVFLAMLGRDPQGTVDRLDAAARRGGAWRRAYLGAFTATLITQSFPGRSGEALDRLRTVTAEVRRGGDRWVLTHVLFLLAELESFGDTGRAEELMEEAERTTRELGLADQLAALLGHRAVIGALAGRGEWAAALLDEAEASSATPDTRQSLAFYRAEVELRSGAPEAARDRLLEVLFGADQSNSVTRLHMEPLWRAVLARAYLAAGDIGEARRSAAGAWALLDKWLQGQQAAMVGETAALILGAEDGGAVEAAGLLGAAEALRGLPFTTDGALRALTRDLVKELGQDRYEEEYARWASAGPDEAVGMVGRVVEGWD
ncbi:BTAD domain-containing putative transcriptional regulator [Nocardiopsis sp. RSe5-2]|uniref:BTAD domain-containing putative transcriptional regulator n=1 Tax=Nocardiopsis endophytica TaxID=3018445 RepID=A0ABT4UBN1_9ACTN|nr:BTAD domain-containing putative transcriptional regulator [Nocardiopsis endophytica]MDA2814394.1 BTAD domain-containing putative transcriptional regulator [Nocardiopsis endophytica]